MTPLERLFDATSAFDYQITVTVLLVIGAMLVVAPIAALSLGSAGLISESTRSDILIRTRSWLVIALIVLIPILLGAFWAMALVLLISLLGYTEFARITGLFRERLVSLTVLVGILLVNLTVLDNWYGLFVALAPLGVVTIAIVGILSDRPSGYIQRIALGSLGFLLFGVCLGHLAFIGNSEIYRALMIVLILTVALNDIFAYITGKALGRRKLCPNTSPNKTIAGALGA
ncbi:MAG: phosphatidate cytidylyltransferase, partial [Phycisphaerales bacterium JB043]